MALPRDVRAVFAAKTARTFGYGFLGVLLPVYLTDLGLGATAIGAVVTLLLAGSAGLTWAVRRPAELWGSRTTLLGLAVLSVLAAGLLVATHEPWLVVLAALLANVAVGTGETGPFLTLDQVLVARAVPAARRTTILSWYNLLGYGAAAVGAATIRVVPAPRALFAVFLLVAVVQCAAYAALGRGLAPARRPPGAPRPSAPLIRRLAALFALDSFAGGFVLQALVAYFLHARYGLGLVALGGV
ncbi:MAG: hypothetical protein HY729_11615 [Candidatus Rokubacteria bacterium]|nr:hypothetical protein [Candidatus Rokubacteria bacterium]